MTELDFLLNLLLEHKIPKTTQTAIRERIALIQQKPQSQVQAVVKTVDFRGIQQSPSMQAKIEAMEQDMNSGQHPTVAPAPIPLPPQPSTVAANNALKDRDQLIKSALAGKKPHKPYGND